MFSTFEKNNYFVLFFTFYYFLEENILFNYNLHVIFFLVPNCPFYYVGAKLSWCQIVRCQIVRCQIVHFYYVGAKLSVFIWLVPNCPVPNCLVPNFPVPNCPFLTLGAKFSDFNSWSQIVWCEIARCQIVLQLDGGITLHLI